MPCPYGATPAIAGKSDARARAEQMSPADRLAYHQRHSGPPMRGLLWWLYEQVEQRLQHTAGEKTTVD